jgi:hypothetical protein
MPIETEKEFTDALQVRGMLGQDLTDTEMVQFLRGRQYQAIMDLSRINNLSVKRITELLSGEYLELDDLIEYAQEKVAGDDTASEDGPESP